MHKITAANIISAIRQLPKNQDYNYISPRTKGLIRIIDVAVPEGGISFKRWTPSNGETVEKAKVESISSQLIWRVANAFVENQAINIDRVLGASYNTRSVLESLIAHTPQFYFCYPGRIEDIAGNVEIKHGHKHLMWIPSEPHRNGVLAEKKTNIAISEIPMQSVSYDLVVPPSINGAEIDVNVARRHTQIQVALYLIGLHLGYRTWIAQNDKGIIYNDKPLIEQSGIVTSLQNEPMVYPHDGAVQAGLFIDCIWFQNHKLMPAIMEVEQSTGVTSGLTRMLNFQSKLPNFKTRYVIVAPDDDRQHVVKEANKDIFKTLNTLFFPYSAVEEMYYLCEKRNLNRQSVTEEFLDCFMEKAVVALD
jgi:type II restriction enzyme